MPSATPTPTPTTWPSIMVGLPYSDAGELADTAASLGCKVLISAGSLWNTRTDRRQGWKRIGASAWQLPASLDSAGFTAMKLGGYRWTVQQFVDFVVTNGGNGDSDKPFPWRWWSAMDYCCEPEIAADRAEVERRIALTIESYGDTLDALQAWRDEGVTDVPDPMPILQGRTPADYVRCALELAAKIDQVHRCTCHLDADSCTAEWHRAGAGLPDLVGVGSVCRRQLNGPDGLLAVLEALHEVLPANVRLHLFGVKGAALRHLVRFGDRIASIDSMAWDTAARHDANHRRAAGEADVRNTVAVRATFMRAWYAAQVAVRDEAFLARDQAVADELPPTPPRPALVAMRLVQLELPLPRLEVLRAARAAATLGLVEAAATPAPMLEAAAAHHLAPGAVPTRAARGPPFTDRTRAARSSC